MSEKPKPKLPSKRSAPQEDVERTELLRQAQERLRLEQERKKEEEKSAYDKKHDEFRQRRDEARAILEAAAAAQGIPIPPRTVKVKTLNYDLIRFIFPEVEEALMRIENSRYPRTRLEPVLAVLNEYVAQYEKMERTHQNLQMNKETYKGLFAQLNEIQTQYESTREQLLTGHEQQIAELNAENDRETDLEKAEILSSLPDGVEPDEEYSRELEAVSTRNEAMLADKISELEHAHGTAKLMEETSRDQAVMEIRSQLEQLKMKYAQEKITMTDLFNQLRKAMNQLEHPDDARPLNDVDRAFVESFHSADNEKKALERVTLVPQVKREPVDFETYLLRAKTNMMEAKAIANNLQDRDEGAGHRRVRAARAEHEDGAEREEAEGYESEASSHDEEINPDLLDSEDEEEPEDEVKKLVKKEIKQLSEDEEETHSVLHDEEVQEEAQEEEEEEEEAQEEEEVKEERPKKPYKEAKSIKFQEREFLSEEERLLENIPGISKISPQLFATISQELHTLRSEMRTVQLLFSRLETEVAEPFCDRYYEAIRPRMMEMLVNRYNGLEFEENTPISEIVSLNDEQKMILRRYLNERNELDIVQELKVRLEEADITNQLFTNCRIGSLVDDFLATKANHKFSFDMLTSDLPELVAIRRDFISTYYDSKVDCVIPKLLAFLCYGFSVNVNGFDEPSPRISPEQYLLIQEFFTLHATEKQEFQAGLQMALDFSVKGEVAPLQNLSARAKGFHDDFMAYRTMKPADKLVFGVPLLLPRNPVFRPEYDETLIKWNAGKILINREIKAVPTFLENKVVYEYDPVFGDLGDTLSTLLRDLMIKLFNGIRTIRPTYFLKYILSHCSMEQYMFLKFYMGQEGMKEDFERQMEHYRLAVLWADRVLKSFPITLVGNSFAKSYKGDPDYMESILGFIYKLLDFQYFQRVNQMFMESSKVAPREWEKLYRQMIPESLSLSFPKCEFVFTTNTRALFRSYFSLEHPFYGGINDFKAITDSLSKLETTQDGLLTPVSEGRINEVVMENIQNESEVDAEFVKKMVSIIRQNKVVQIIKESINRKINPSDGSKPESTIVINALNESMEQFKVMVPRPSNQPVAKHGFVALVLRVIIDAREIYTSVNIYEFLNEDLQAYVYKGLGKKTLNSSISKLLKEHDKQMAARERALVSVPQFGESRVEFTLAQIVGKIDKVMSKDISAFTDRDRKARIHLLYSLIYEYVVTQLRQQLMEDRYKVMDDILLLEDTERLQASAGGMPSRTEEPKSVDQYVQTYQEMVQRVKASLKGKRSEEEFAQLWASVENATLADVNQLKSPSSDKTRIIPTIEEVADKLRSELPYGREQPSEYVRYDYFMKNEEQQRITINEEIAQFMNGVVFMNTPNMEYLTKNRSVAREYIGSAVPIRGEIVYKPSLLFIQRMIDEIPIKQGNMILLDNVSHQLGRIQEGELIPFHANEYDTLIQLCEVRSVEDLFGTLYVQSHLEHDPLLLPISNVPLAKLKAELRDLENTKQNQLFIPVEKEKRRVELIIMINAMEHRWGRPRFELLKAIVVSANRYSNPLLVNGVEYRFGHLRGDHIREIINPSEEYGVLITRISDHFIQERERAMGQIEFVEAPVEVGDKRTVLYNPIFSGKKSRACYVCEKEITQPYLTTLLTGEKPKMVWICSSDCSENFQLITAEE